MPLYEYVCLVCGQRFEHIQSFDGPPAAICPAGHQSVRRMLGHPAIHFRGKGFYVTDNRKTSNGASR